MFRIILNLLFPILFVVSIILVVYGITFYFSQVRMKSKKGRIKAIVLGSYGFVYIATFLISSAFERVTTNRKILSRLHGQYLYFDSSTSEINNIVISNLPRLELNPDKSFSFHIPSTQDSVILGTWQTDPESQILTLRDKTGRLLWRPRWDTISSPTTLLFKQQGQMIAYHKFD